MSDAMETRQSIADPSLDVERAVRERYSKASKKSEARLCCPVEYDARYLDVLPAELIERDYGCGDPSRYVQEGECVLDLGSGGGKVCYIAAQIVGPQGHVVGVDMNDDMLALARRYQHEIGDRIGFHNVAFRKGRIQDLALDMEKFEAYLAENPVRTADGWLRAQAETERLRLEEPMIDAESIDVIVSNCVLNLVRTEARHELFQGMHRVLRCAGRAVISDIVSDEPVPQELRKDPQLWSGCISGAFVEEELIDAFRLAGFYGLEIVARQDQPWATIEGIEFRSITVRAFKGKEAPCLDHHQAVIYRGPWKNVQDDDGHTLRRGVRTAVCEKTFGIYTQTPYADQIIPISPCQQVSSQDARPFDCHRAEVRHPQETKGKEFRATNLPESGACDADGCC